MKEVKVPLLYVKSFHSMSPLINDGVDLTVAELY